MRGNRTLSKTRLGERLLSRKFWFSVVSFGVLVGAQAYAEAASVVIAFVAVQGAIEAFATPSNTEPPSTYFDH